MMKETETKSSKNNAAVKVNATLSRGAKGSKRGLSQFRESSRKDDSSQIPVGFTIASVHCR